MLKRETQLITESERSEKEGSLILFNVNDFSKYSISKKMLFNLKKLYQKSLSIDDRVLTIDSISKVLEIKKPSVRRMIQSLIESKTLEKVDDFVHLKNKKINMYQFINPLKNKNITSESSTKESEFSECDRYINIEKEEQVYSIDEGKLTNTIFGISELSKLNNHKYSFNFHQVLSNKPNKNVHVSLVDKIKYDKNEYILKTKIESIGFSCLEVKDIPFIYALISLTQKYHRDAVNIYKNYNKNKKIKNLTPILTQNIIHHLGKLEGTSNNRFVYKKMQQAESNKFGVTIIKKDKETDEEISIPQKLFEIVMTKKRNNVGGLENASPYIYYLKWNVEILKKIFSEEIWFVHSIKALSLKGYVFVLYNTARSILNHKRKYTSNLDDLVRLFSIVNKRPTRNEFVMNLINDFKSSFEGKCTIKRNGKLNKGKIYHFSCRSSVGGLTFNINIDLIDKNYELNLEIYESYKGSVIESANQFLLEGKKHNDKNVLSKYNLGNLAPVYFNNLLPYFSKKIEDDNFVTIEKGSEIEEKEELTFSNLLSSKKEKINSEIVKNIGYDVVVNDACRIKIRRSKYMLIADIYTSDGMVSIKITSILRPSCYNEQVRKIITISKNSPYSVVNRVSKLIKKINTIEDNFGNELTEDVFYNSLEFFRSNDNSICVMEYFSMITRKIRVINKINFTESTAASDIADAVKGSFVTA